WSNGPGTNSHFYERWRIRPAICPLKQQVVGKIGDVLWVVMATISLVMLIACANVASLLLVRAEARQQELAVRAALGAGWGRLVRELLVESWLLSLAGGALGIALAYEGVTVLVRIGPANLPRLGEISIDARVFGFTLLVSLLSGLLLGLIPALKYAAPRIAIGVRSVERTASMSRERHRMQNVLVVVQMALALVLLVSAGLMIRTVQALRAVAPGFSDAQHLETMRISIPDSLVPAPQRVTRIQNDIVNKLMAIPGVTAAGFASEAPMEGVDSSWDEIFAEDKKELPEETPPLRFFKYVSPGFLRASGTRMVAGHELTWNDTYDLRPVVLVSENLAREMWGTPAAAIGKRIREFSKMPWREVVGVVEDVRERGIEKAAPETVYWPSIMHDIYGPGTFEALREATFVVRSERAGSESFRKQVREAVWSVNAEVPVAAVRTMQEICDESLARVSFTLVMLGIAGAMALVLGVVGIYGVISYGVSQRRREIGIRLALGAQQDALKRMFVRHGLVLASAGVVIGLGAALALTRILKALLFGISAQDPIIFVAAPLVLASAAMLASYVPARRAAAVDPVEVLKAE
ncbi:MAG: FtsX-like permease family protein, partial [Acidobacteriaceae bacterium]|nr:FtsX-like permease family protein [Acidobacteriaceae bacterium]